MRTNGASDGASDSSDGAGGIRWQPCHVARGPITIRLAVNEAIVGGHRIPLTATELRVLAFLLARCGGLAAYVAIVRAVWKRSGEGVEGKNLVRPHVQSLRRKFARCPGVTIDTVPGRGYRLLLGEVQ